MHRSAWVLRLLLHVIVYRADSQDRDGGILLLANLFGSVSFLEEAVRRRQLSNGRTFKRPWYSCLSSELKSSSAPITPKNDLCCFHAVGPSTIAWLNHCRRLAQDWENLDRKAFTFLRLASIHLMLRKLWNPP
jgi:hypothetical protein